ncbi:MAG: helix-turn-helix domain-containing protein [Clostridiaceae bacterium]
MKKEEYKILNSYENINLPNKLLTVTEVSRIIKSNKNYVYNLINSGLLKALKLGSLKVTQAELMRFLDQYNGMDLSDFDNIKKINGSQDQ